MPEESHQKKSSGNKTILIIIVVIAVLVLLGGLSYFLQQKSAEKTAEKVIEDATGGKVDISEGGNKVSIETDEGKLTVGQNQVPENFPSDVSIYPGSEVVTSSESGENFTLTLTTSDSVSKVGEFYRDDLEKNGWSISEAPIVGDSFITTGTKGTRKVDIIAAPNNDGKTGITIVLKKS